VSAIGFEARQSLPQSSEMIPIGGIALWSGTLLDVPLGWQLCDGTNGSPDLRGKFLKGAGPDDPVDGVGGALTHTHDFNGAGHTHSADDTESVAGSGPAEAWAGGSPSDSSEAAGVTDEGDSLPPFYNLAYIQRMQ